MNIGIVEMGDGKLAGIFREKVTAEVANVDVSVKKALDLFDVLAFAKQFSGKVDQLIIIVQLNDDEPDRKAFMEALANLEASTGQPVFKCFYEGDGKAAVESGVERFINWLYHPEKLKKTEQQDETQFQF